MFRLTNSLKTLKITPEVFSNKSYEWQTVRWRKRKPIHLGTAKSKLFRVPKRPQLPTEEMEEIKRIFNIYRTQMKSVKAYFTSKYAMSVQETVTEELKQKEFEEDFIKCSFLNDEWNSKVKMEREARFDKILQEDMKFALNRLESVEAEEQQKFEKFEEEVRKQKLLAPTFITFKNLDEAIEKALSTEVDHNYSIDLEGNRYVGRETTPDKVKT